MKSCKKKRSNFVYKTLSFLIAFTFIVNTVLPPSYAQVVAPSVLNLPPAGTMVGVSPTFTPSLMKGVNIHPDNPLKLDFVIDRGDTNLQGDEFNQEATKLIKYFLAALTVPEEEMWVNLSPYEKDRIIPEHFGRTEMGRDLLAQDYMLKQLSSSLMHPEESLGKEFWHRVHTKAQEQFGTTDIPMDTFNKIWIVPQEAFVYEHTKGAFVMRSHLKVMLEEDYLALEANQESTKHGLGDVGKDDIEVMSGVSSDVVREALLPEIEKEVNQGKTFANLRQIYHAVILATWYKQALKDSLLGQIYVDQNKTDGVDVKDKTINQRIYNQYLAAFKKGVYNFIKEDHDPATQEVIPRKYFSGGASAKGTGALVQGRVGKGNLGEDLARLSPQFLNAAQAVEGGIFTVQVQESTKDEAMVAIRIVSNLSPAYDSIRELVTQEQVALSQSLDSWPAYLAFVPFKKLDEVFHAYSRLNSDGSIHVDGANALNYYKISQDDGFIGNEVQRHAAAQGKHKEGTKYRLFVYERDTGKSIVRVAVIIVIPPTISGILTGVLGLGRNLSKKIEALRLQSQQTDVAATPAQVGEEAKDGAMVSYEKALEEARALNTRENILSGILPSKEVAVIVANQLGRDVDATLPLSAGLAIAKAVQNDLGVVHRTVLERVSYKFEGTATTVMEMPPRVDGQGIPEEVREEAADILVEALVNTAEDSVRTRAKMQAERYFRTSPRGKIFRDFLKRSGLDHFVPFVDLLVEEGIQDWDDYPGQEDFLDRVFRRARQIGERPDVRAQRGHQAELDRANRESDADYALKMRAMPPKGDRAQLGKIPAAGETVAYEDLMTADFREGELLKIGDTREIGAFVERDQEEGTFTVQPLAGNEKVFTVGGTYKWGMDKLPHVVRMGTGRSVQFTEDEIARILEEAKKTEILKFSDEQATRQLEEQKVLERLRAMRTGDMLEISIETRYPVPEEEDLEKKEVKTVRVLTFENQFEVESSGTLIFSGQFVRGRYSSPKRFDYQRSTPRSFSGHPAQVWDAKDEAMVTDYKIRTDGETLLGLAQRYGMTPERILEINPEIDLRAPLKKGDTVKLIFGPEIEIVGSIGELSPEALENLKRIVAKGGSEFFVVRLGYASGDRAMLAIYQVPIDGVTLLDLVRNYRIAPQKILEINPGIDLDAPLRKGQVINMVFGPEIEVFGRIAADGLVPAELENLRRVRKNSLIAVVILKPHEPENEAMAALDVDVSAQPLVQFYLGLRGDHRGRKIQEMWDDDHGTLENGHDVIQMMFPLWRLDASFERWVSGTPEDKIIWPQYDDRDIEIWKGDTQTGRLLRMGMIRSLETMLNFYGFRFNLDNPDEVTIERGDNFDERRRNWLQVNNHNFLRITRILNSLRFAGLEKYAMLFFNALQEVYGEYKGVIAAFSYDYWLDSASRIETDEKLTLAEHKKNTEIAMVDRRTDRMPLGDADKDGAMVTETNRTVGGSDLTFNGRWISVDEERWIREVPTHHLIMPRVREFRGQYPDVERIQTVVDEIFLKIRKRTSGKLQQPLEGLSEESQQKVSQLLRLDLLSDLYGVVDSYLSPSGPEARRTEAAIRIIADTREAIAKELIASGELGQLPKIRSREELSEGDLVLIEEGENANRTFIGAPDWAIELEPRLLARDPAVSQVVGDKDGAMISEEMTTEQPDLISLIEFLRNRPYIKVWNAETKSTQQLRAGSNPQDLIDQLKEIPGFGPLTRFVLDSHYTGEADLDHDTVVVIIKELDLGTQRPQRGEESVRMTLNQPDLDSLQSILSDRPYVYVRFRGVFDGAPDQIQVHGASDLVQQLKQMKGFGLYSQFTLTSGLHGDADLDYDTVYVTRYTERKEAPNTMEDGAMVTEVTLKNGDVVPEQVVAVIMTTLRTLLDSGDFSDIMTVYELREKARNPEHRIFGNLEDKLIDISLLQTDGHPHDLTRTVVLAAVDGEGMDIKLVSPIKSAEDGTMVANINEDGSALKGVVSVEVIPIFSVVYPSVDVTVRREGELGNVFLSLTIMRNLLTTSGLVEQLTNTIAGDLRTTLRSVEGEIADEDTIKRVLRKHDESPPLEDESEAGDKVSLNASLIITHINDAIVPLRIEDMYWNGDYTAGEIQIIRAIFGAAGIASQKGSTSVFDATEEVDIPQLVYDLYGGIDVNDGARAIGKAIIAAGIVVSGKGSDTVRRAILNAMQDDRLSEYKREDYTPRTRFLIATVVATAGVVSGEGTDRVLRTMEDVNLPSHTSEIDIGDQLIVKAIVAAGAVIGKRSPEEVLKVMKMAVKGLSYNTMYQGRSYTLGDKGIVEAIIAQALVTVAEDEAMLVQVTLKNGDVVPKPAVAVIMITLQTLLESGDFSDIMAVYELREKARNPEHRIFGNLEDKLIDISLLQTDGHPHDVTRAVVLSAVEGEGMDIKLVSPIKPDDAPTKDEAMVAYRQSRGRRFLQHLKLWGGTAVVLAAASVAGYIFFDVPRYTQVDDPDIPALTGSFEVNEKVFKLGDVFDIKVNGESVGTITEKLISFGKQFTLGNAENEVIAVAKQKPISWGVHIEVFDHEGNLIGSIEEHVFKSLLKVETVYDIKDADGNKIATSIKRDIFATSITLTDQEELEAREIATINRGFVDIFGDRWQANVTVPNVVDSRILAMIAAYKTSADNDREAEEERKKSDSALLGVKPRHGGIDFNPAIGSMNIQRDGDGVALPVFEQPIENININGLIPVIINVTPLQNNLPFILGFISEEKAIPPSFRNS